MFVSLLGGLNEGEKKWFCHTTEGRILPCVGLVLKLCPTSLIRVVVRDSRKKLSILFFVLALSVLLVACWRTGKACWDLCANRIWQPELVCEETVFDFGDVPQDKEMSHEFVLRNRGDREVLIESVTPGCGSCLRVDEYPKAPILPNQEGVVKLTLISSNFEPGEYLRKLAVVKSTDPNNRNFLLTIKATIQVPPPADNAS